MSQNETPHADQLEPMPQRTVEVELSHGQTGVDLRYGTPLMARDQVMAEYGRDGDLLAVISLPGEAGEKDKQIGVMDFGEPDPDNPRWVLTIDDENGEAIPIKLLGQVKARYGLVPLNYGMSNDPRRGYVDVVEGDAMQLGREEDFSDMARTSYHLGLDTKNRGNKAISGSHATLQVTDGQLTVIDHSSNGTKVRSAI